VAAETKGEWPNAFFFNQNLNRAMEPMENHSGIPVLYEFLVICVFFAPWSSFLIITLRSSLKRAVGQRHTPERLLLCWLGVYFVGCAAASTKLSHYVAPVYPALAILTARLLTRYWQRDFNLPTWASIGAAGCYIFMGVVLSSLCIAGATGVFATLESVESRRVFPGLMMWAWIGLVPMAGGFLMILAQRKDRRGLYVLAAAVSAVLVVALFAAGPMVEIDRAKAPKAVVSEAGLCQPEQELHIASWEFTRASLTFYCQRRVERLQSAEQVKQFLNFPVKAYVIMPEHDWINFIQTTSSEVPLYVVAKHYDFMIDGDVVIISNQPPDVTR
jgi:4-amino-4-deoxy-L-arabinose transferase-like glycosyltransferase